MTLKKFKTILINPRKHFNEEKLEELSGSIKDKGVLQPVIVRKAEDGNIYLVAGERRLRASKMAGKEKIPAILTKGNPVEISIIENLQRENLLPIEEAEALNEMVQKYEYTHEQMAQAIGKSRSTITETLSLNKLPEEIKEECRRADIYPRRLLLEISKQKTPEKMLQLFKKTKEGKLKSDQVRDITRNERRARRSSAEVARGKISDISRHLQRLNMETLEKEEKMNLLMELEALKKMIEGMTA